MKQLRADQSNHPRLELVHAPDPSPQPLTLVERVSDAIAAQATSAGIVNDRPARAAIREVAKWLRFEAQAGPVGLSAKPTDD